MTLGERVPIVHAHNFSYRLLNPVLGYLMSCLGAFIGLRCAARAQAHAGTQRALWLLLASVSLGATGIWAMHFIAMLGFTVPGQTLLYNVPLTILSMIVAVVVVAIGLSIVGFSRTGGPVPLATGGVIIGLGVAGAHYLGMQAISMPEMMRYNIPLVVLSVVIAIAAGTAALWAGLKVRAIWPTIAASLIFGVAVTGMHYAGMAAMRLYAGNGGIYGAGQNTVTTGEAASGFVLPLVLGIGIFSFLALIVIMLAPSEDEVLADARLAGRLTGGPVSHRR
jgi:NO-binding membrane sensor protein with MHYT domain